MSKIKESYDIQANLRYIVNSVGWKAFVESVGAEDLMKALVEELGPEKADEMWKQVRSDGRSPRRKKRKKSK